MFTTVKKKIKKQEKYDFPVLTQHSYNSENKNMKTKFSLNKAAMEELGFVLNTANVNKISIGYNNDNELVVANIETEGLYCSNITAENNFANQTFMDRLVTRFGIDPIQEHEFRLWSEVDEGVPIASMTLYSDEPVIDDVAELVDETEVEIVRQQTVLNSIF